MNFRKPLLKTLLGIKNIASGGNSNVNKYFSEILKLEFCNRSEIEDIQQNNLEKILLHSYNHTKYYKRVFNQIGLIQNNKVNFDKFNKIPFLTKDIMRKYKDELISDNHKNIYWNTSGGSTGEPVEFMQDSVYKAHNWASALYYNHVLGKELGDREAKFWGSERDVLKGSIGIIPKFENFLYNRLLLNTFNMTSESMREYIKEINKFNPKSLWAYVDSVYELARFIERESIKISSIPVTITTTGPLTEDMRNTIERALKTKVFNQYGSREVGPIACECLNCEGLHVFEWDHYIEIIDSSGNALPSGEMGEVCITLLTNFSMPLIRYQIGDTAIISEKFCSCGRKTTLFKEVTGRVFDHFVNSEGTLIHGQYFTSIFFHRPWVERFQVVQEDINHIIINLVAREIPPNSEKEEIIGIIHKVMGKSCKVDFQFQRKIKPTASGKYRYTICNIR